MKQRFVLILSIAIGFAAMALASGCSSARGESEVCAKPSDCGVGLFCAPNHVCIDPYAYCQASEGCDYGYCSPVTTSLMGMPSCRVGSEEDCENSKRCRKLYGEDPEERKLGCNARGIGESGDKNRCQFK